MHTLEPLWNNTIRELGIVPSEKSTSIFYTIVRMYETENRYYHTLKHVGMMLDKINVLSSIYSITEYNKAIMYYSAFMHDFVYTTNHLSDSSMEELSAMMAVDFLRDMNCDTVILLQTVYDLIVVTKDHTVSEKLTATVTMQEIFIDCDLAIFSKSRLQYKKYSENIRKEYIHVPEEIFLNKRHEILKSFLNKNIFNVEYMKQTYSNVAIENINWELDMIEKKVIEILTTKE